MAIDESRWGGHAGVSALTLGKAGYDCTLQTVVGQHHGFTPAVEMRNAADECFGGEEWQKERVALLDALSNDLGVSLPKNLTEAQVRAISGLTSVADWIGSGSLFDNPDFPLQSSVESAITNAGYVPFRSGKGWNLTTYLDLARERHKVN